MPLKMVEEAATAHNCLDWLHICGAECCKQMMFEGEGIDKIDARPGKLLQINTPGITPDMKWWYELHGARVEGNTVIVRAERIQKLKNKIIVHKRCNNLTEDLRCKEHASGNRPEHCKSFDEKSATKEYKHCLTDRCLYKFK